MRLWSDRKYLALAPAGLVAFNPQFIYLSAAINNDIIAALTGTAVLYVCLLLLRDGLANKNSLRMGVLFGLAVLSKIHLVALAPVIVLTLGIAVWKQHGDSGRDRVKKWLRSLATVFTITGIAAGWWFIRNVLLISM